MIILVSERTVREYGTSKQRLSSGEIDKKNFAEKSKEYSDLNTIINDAKNYISFEKEKIELEKILSDKKTDIEILKMGNKVLCPCNETSVQKNINTNNPNDH